MFQRLFDHVLLAALAPPGLNSDSTREILERHGVEAWHTYALEQWSSRWHVWRAIRWVVTSVPRQSRVLETGCGCGWNLFWLAANGFVELEGIDVSVPAVTAGSEIASISRLPVTLRYDDAITPRTVADGSFDVVLALNWTYHVKEFNLQGFLRCYRTIITTGGYLVIDMIDSLYNNMPNSSYLTSDWVLPESQRRPSEYLHRMSEDEASLAASEHGFVTVARFSRKSTVPHFILVVRKG